jgi:hypothetical protein
VIILGISINKISGRISEYFYLGINDLGKISTKSIPLQYAYVNKLPENLEGIFVFGDIQGLDLTKSYLAGIELADYLDCHGSG